MAQGIDVSLANGDIPNQFIDPSAAINVDIDATNQDEYFRIESLDIATFTITVRDEANVAIASLGTAVDNTALGGAASENRRAVECFRLASGTLTCHLL